MNTVQLSDVQLVNLTLLLTLRDGVLQEGALACCRYALSAEQSDRLRSMSVQQVLAIVSNLGDTLLFPPRADLVSLLNSPLPLARPLATARATRHRDA